MADYFNAPGAAAFDSVQGYLAQQAQLKAQALDNQLAVNRDRREQQRFVIEQEDKEKADIARQISNMVPGDIPPPELIAKAKQHGVPLPQAPTPTPQMQAQNVEQQGTMGNALLGGQPGQAGKPEGASSMPGAGVSTIAPKGPVEALPRGGAYLGTPEQQNRIRLGRTMGDPNANPDQVMSQAVRLGLEKSAEPYLVAKARTEEMKNASADRVAATNAATDQRAETARQGQEAANDRAANSLAEKQRHDEMMAQLKANAAEAKKDAEGVPLLSEGAKKRAAILYRETFTLPPIFGGGKEGIKLRADIMNMGDNWDRATNTFTDPKTGVRTPGPEEDPGSVKAAYDSNKQALTQAVKNQTAVNTFAATADKNSKLLDSLLDKLPDTGVRVVNRRVREVYSQLGSEDVQAFRTMLPSVQTEYARLIAQPNLTGVLAESARKEIGTTLPDDATIGQLRVALKLLKQEGQNRKDAIGDQISALQSAVKAGTPGTTSGNSKSGPPELKWNADHTALVPVQ